MDKKVELLQEKFINRIISRQTTVMDAINKIEREGGLLNDYIVPLPAIEFKANGRLQVQFNGELLGLHDNAVGQFAEKFKIPTRYLREMAHGSQWQREAIAQLLRSYAAYWNREKFLIRAVGDTVRGVLSDKYRRINSLEVIKQFLNGASGYGAMIFSVSAADCRTHIEVMMPEITMVETPRNGTVPVVMGCQLSNSDFGKGALDLKSYLVNVVCINGITRKSYMREIHLGGKLPDNLELSHQTLHHDTERSKHLMSDAINAIFKPETINAEIEVIKQASSKEVDIDMEIKKLPKLGLTKQETEATQSLLLRNSPEDGLQGEPSLWKMAQALTAVARDAESERSREIQEIAGKMLGG